MAGVDRAELDVTPFYSQVFIADADWAECPDWESENQMVTANDECITVVTRQDEFGEVRVTVVRGGDPDADLMRAWTGRLRVGDRGVMAGNYVGNELIDVPVPKGEYTVDVYVDREWSPSRVTFVLRE